MRSSDLSFRILDVDVRVRCPDPRLRSLVACHWSGMRLDRDRGVRANSGACGAERVKPGEENGSTGSLDYEIARDRESGAISFSRPGLTPQTASDEGLFLYELEADATIKIQTLRSRLYFLHAAVAEVDGKAYLFVAESGGGKSTTLWGMLHHGWSYFSDELAPIELDTMWVHAYPRALGLKRRPPAGYPLPETALQTPRTFHVPVDSLPRVSALACCPLEAAYFVKYCPDASGPSICPIGAGEAAARLYANSLNQLAHDNAGLAAAVRITKAIRSYSLRSAELAATCALLEAHRLGAPSVNSD